MEPVTICEEQIYIYEYAKCLIFMFTTWCTLKYISFLVYIFILQQKIVNTLLIELQELIE